MGQCGTQQLLLHHCLQQQLYHLSFHTRGVVLWERDWRSHFNKVPSFVWKWWGFSNTRLLLCSSLPHSLLCKRRVAKASRGCYQPCSSVATEGCSELELVLRRLGDEAAFSVGFLGLLFSLLPCDSLRQFHIDKLSLLLKVRP